MPLYIRLGHLGLVLNMAVAKWMGIKKPADLSFEVAGFFKALTHPLMR